MVKSLNKAMDELITYLLQHPDYQACLELKEKMEQSGEILSLIDDIKITQKKYVQSNYDEVFKIKLDELEKRLYLIPIYVLYMQHLERVNEMIEFVKDEMNQYFYQLLNE